MSEAKAKPVRPLYFIASYPRSGGSWVLSAVYLLITLTRPDAPRTIDLGKADASIPWDADGLLYRAVTGRSSHDLDELEVAEARPRVHALLATGDFALPVIRTHAIRGTFHGHETINSDVTRGGAYAVRNPLEIAAALVRETGVGPLQIIQLMMMSDRRVRAAEHTVVEPLGSWSQNVASWTAAGQKEILVLRHEDIVRDARRELGKLARHIAVPATEAVIAQAGGLLAEVVRAEVREEGRHDFRDSLQPAHARAIIEAHAIEMERHGYLTEDVLRYADIDRASALRIAAKYAPAMIS